MNNKEIMLFVSKETGTPLKQVKRDFKKDKKIIMDVYENILYMKTLNKEEYIEYVNQIQIQNKNDIVETFFNKLNITSNNVDDCADEYKMMDNIFRENLLDNEEIVYSEDGRPMIITKSGVLNDEN